MIKAEFNKGECKLNTSGSNFEIMIEASVIMVEITKCLMSDCPSDLKSHIVDMFKDSINYAIDCGTK